MEQQVTVSNRDVAWRSWKVGDMNDKSEEERRTDSGNEERKARYENGSPEERRKRPLKSSEAVECSAAEERSNKHSKSGGSESEHDAATADLDKRPSNVETTPRSRTSPLTSTTASPGPILTIVRQTSVVPGLEDTESAAWDAAQSDSVIGLLPLKEQTQMVRTALSLGSEKGIKELWRFLSNASMDGKRGSESLVSEFNLIAPYHDSTSRLASNALVPQPDRLAYFSALYQRLDVLESKETLFAVIKRANLAALVQYRESLVPSDVGGNRARDANLRLFRVICPNHSTVERPEDKAVNPAASQDWIRLRNRLKEVRAWLKVRNLFGEDDAFLALPPHCVPDSHISRIPARNFSPLLGLLDVAWRVLDDCARCDMMSVCLTV
jgi:hypothetical protein